MSAWLQALPDLSGEQLCKASPGSDPHQQSDLQQRDHAAPLKVSHHLRPSNLPTYSPAQIQRAPSLPCFAHQSRLLGNGPRSAAAPPMSASLGWDQSQTCTEHSQQHIQSPPKLPCHQAWSFSSPCLSLRNQQQKDAGCSQSLSLSISSAVDLDDDNLLDDSLGSTDSLSDHTDSLPRSGLRLKELQPLGLCGDQAVSKRGITQALGTSCRSNTNAGHRKSRKRLVLDAPVWKTYTHSHLTRSHLWDKFTAR